MLDSSGTCGGGSCTVNMPQRSYVLPIFYFTKTSAMFYQIQKTSHPPYTSILLVNKIAFHCKLTDPGKVPRALIQTLVFALVPVVLQCALLRLVCRVLHCTIRVLFSLTRLYSTGSHALRSELSSTFRSKTREVRFRLGILYVTVVYTL